MNANGPASNALARELRRAGLTVTQQRGITITDDGGTVANTASARWSRTQS